MLNQIIGGTRQKLLGSVLFICIFSVGAVFATMAAPDAASAGDKVTIVSVDTKVILKAHPAFSDARDEIRQEVEAKKAELDAMEEGDRQMAQQQMQQDLQEKSMKLQEESLQKVKEDIQKAAKQLGYDYVVDSKVLIAGGKDVTQEIMETLDLKTDSESEPAESE